ncbi:hypothetical protein J6590_003912 [Homalodisca vitripennis]|nr:hypothetical protein J6590_003912 [Homalodisca vitripennis]
MVRRRKTQLEDMTSKTSEANPLLALLLVLRLYGHVPVTTHQSGNVSFSACSGAMVYCMAATAVQLTMVGYSVRWFILQEEFWANFDNTMSSVSCFVILLSALHPVFFTWADTPLIARFVNQWNHLQVRTISC